MPINAHPEFLAAEREYALAGSIEEKIPALEKMISLAPKHKGGENLRAQLKTRLKKLKEQSEKTKKSGKSSRIGIKKEDMQAVIIGKAKTGKSSLLSLLTNAKPEISEYGFATKSPVVGIMGYNSVSIQMIEVPAAESEFYDKGLANSADTLLIIVKNLKEISEIENIISKSPAKKIFVFNKIDLLSENEKRKISATLQSKKYNFVLISTKTGENLAELKEKLFQSFGKIRIYTKEPGKNKSENPIILPPNSDVKDVAEKILKGFSSKVLQTKMWGPSAKFSGQVVGLNHKLKDLDVVEFKTK